MTQPTHEVTGIIEFTDWYYSPAYRGLGARAEAEACLQLHVDKGLRRVLWSCGRSVVTYQSEDPRITRFGWEADRAAMPPQNIAVMDDLALACPLRSALTFGHRHGMAVIAHLCMNRHYGGERGGCTTSRLARLPEMREVTKAGQPDPWRLSFGAQAYVEERLAIVDELAATGVDGVCLDFLRQPPIMRYHPALVDAYKAEAGVDPRALLSRRNPTEQDLDAFMHWCRFRAGVLTAFMRQARQIVSQHRTASGQPVPLLARISDDGFVANMISGVDIVAWCEQGLIDEMLIHPLQWIHGIWTHDASPFVALGGRTGVKVTGGVNTYKVEGWAMNPVCVAQRIMEQYNAGVAGISLYETNDTVTKPEMAPVLEAVHDRQSLETLLADSSWLEAWPINGLNANCGMDNHSAFSRDLLGDL